MAKMRGFKPDLWSDDVAMIYHGPFPERPRDYYALTRCSWNVAFIYLLFGERDRLLYVGRARNPGNRFDKHRRHKEWWPEVRSLAIFQVTADDHLSSMRAVATAELIAIQELDPVYNIAGRSRCALVQGR